LDTPCSEVECKTTGYPLHSPVSPSLPSRASPCAITFQLNCTTTVSLILFRSECLALPVGRTITVRRCVWRNVGLPIVFDQRCRQIGPNPITTTSLVRTSIITAFVLRNLNVSLLTLGWGGLFTAEKLSILIFFLQRLFSIQPTLHFTPL